MNIRTSIILVVLLLMVAGYVFFVQAKVQPEAKIDAPWFYSVDMADISTIEIDRTGEKAKFSLGDDEHWHIGGSDGYPVGLDRWIGVDLLLSGPKSRRLIDSNPSDLSQYGLAEPSLNIDIGLKSGNEIGILIGSYTPDGENTYVQIDNTNEVFTIFSGWEEVMTRLLEEPPYPEWLYDIEVEAITQIKITRGNPDEGYKGIAFFKDKESNSWQFLGKDNQPIEIQETSMAKVLSAFGKPTQVIEAYEPIGVAQYGLQNPSMVVFVQTERLDIEDELEEAVEVSQYRFRIGDKTEGGDNYFVQTERGEYIIADVFTVNAGWVEGIESVSVEYFE